MVKYTLYYINGCPGARAVRLYLKYKNIEVDEIIIDFSKGDHKTTEFLKLNPMHTVPTLKVTDSEGDIKGVYESRIILKYLDNNTDIEVDKWLYWDLGFLNPNVGKIIYPRIFRNEEPNLKDLPNLIEKMEYLNTTLESNKFLLGNILTIADLSSSMLIENTQICKDLIDVNNYPNIVLWLQNIKNEIGVDKWDSVMEPFYKSMIDKK
jgi:glutathione S-transferase